MYVNRQRVGGEPHPRHREERLRGFDEPAELDQAARSPQAGGGEADERVRARELVERLLVVSGLVAVDALTPELARSRLRRRVRLALCLILLGERTRRPGGEHDDHEDQRSLQHRDRE